MLLTRHRVASILESKLIIKINPDSIEYRAKGKYPVTEPFYRVLELLFRSIKPLNKFSSVLPDRVEPFVIPRSFYDEPIPIKTLNKYQKLKNLLEKRDSIRKSVWYQTLVNEVQTKGVAKYKKISMHNEKEILTFFNTYILQLIKSLETTGFQRSKGSPGNVYIGSDGSLHKSNAGEHRFYIARLLGLKSIPVKINGVHQDWFYSHQLHKDNSQFTKLISSIRQVELNHN